MTNYKFTSGPYRGRVTEEGATILDVSFANLPYEIQDAVVEHLAMEENIVFGDEDLSKEELAAAVRSFENSWDSEETEDPIDLWPVSVVLRRRAIIEGCVRVAPNTPANLPHVKPPPIGRVVILP